MRLCHSLFGPFLVKKMTFVLHLYSIKSVILSKSACLSALYVPDILLGTLRMSGSPLAVAVLLLMGNGARARHAI